MIDRNVSVKDVSNMQLGRGLVIFSKPSAAFEEVIHKESLKKNSQNRIHSSGEKLT